MGKTCGIMALTNDYKLAIQHKLNVTATHNVTAELYVAAVDAESSDMVKRVSGVLDAFTAAGASHKGKSLIPRPLLLSRLLILGSRGRRQRNDHISAWRHH